jgi:hypothetical protein
MANLRFVQLHGLEAHGISQLAKKSQGSPAEIEVLHGNQ